MILDVLLPRANGPDLCRRLRADASAVPILMLTARGGLNDRVEVTGLRPSPLPHHRTCGFPHTAVEVSRPQRVPPDRMV